MSAREIAKVTYLHEEYVRHLIRRFSSEGLNLLKERPHPGRTPKFSEEDRAEIVECAKAPPRLLGQPFSHWSIEKLRAYLIKTRILKSISLETLRTILKEEKVSLQRTKTWKESNDPAFKRKKNA
jgi:transposase